MIIGVILLFPTINYAQSFEITITYRNNIIAEGELYHIMFDTLRTLRVKGDNIRMDKYAVFNNQTYLVNSK